MLFFSYSKYFLSCGGKEAHFKKLCLCVTRMSTKLSPFLVNVPFQVNSKCHCYVNKFYQEDQGFSIRPKFYPSSVHYIDQYIYFSKALHGFQAFCKIYSSWCMGELEIEQKFMWLLKNILAASNSLLLRNMLHQRKV